MTGPNPLVNLCQLTTATTGTGTITLGAASSGYRGTPALTNGTTYSYSIIDGTNYELGQGAYTSSGTTLARGPVQSSSANAAITLSGTAIVIVGDALAWDISAFKDAAAAPSSPTEGDRFFDNTSGINYTYITDANGSQWVETSAAGTPTNGVFSTMALGGATLGTNALAVTGTMDVFRSTVGTYFTGGGGDNATRELAITSSTTTNSGDTHTLNAQSGTGILAFAITGTERARIDSSGNLLVGKTAPGSTGNGCYLSASGFSGFTLAGSTSATDTLDVYSTAASAFRFYVDMAGTIHATSTSISAISDQSLKTNVRPLETGLTEVMALQPRRFDWINGDAENVAGFIAQEVQQVLPELVEEFKYDTSGDTKLGLKMGDMIPTLVKAIQEQQATIATLEARLAALESK